MATLRGGLILLVLWLLGVALVVTVPWGFYLLLRMLS